MSARHPADFFLLRTPALSWDLMHGWSEGLSTAATDRAGGDVESAVDSDTRLLRARLRQIASRPEVREAIQVASPSLYARLQAWLDGDTSEKSLSVESAVVRYLARMAGRPTPFGLFAGYSVGAAAERTSLMVPPAAEHTRRSRLNLDVVYAAAARLAARPEFRPHLRWRGNTSVYRVGGRLRYHAVRVDPKASASLDRRYSIRDLAWSPHIDVALARGVAPGGATLAELAAAIADAFAVPVEDARGYVERLIDEQLFAPSLLPPVTGEDPCEYVIAELRRLPDAAEATALFEAIVADLGAIDASADAEVTRERCDRIASSLGACGVEPDRSALLKVDLRKPCSTVTLERSVLHEIAAGVDLLASLSSSKESPIRAFARAFAERYQGRQVPLVEALDPELGIGFEADGDGESSSLVKGLPFKAPEPKPRVEFGDREALLLDMVMRATRTGALEVELSAADLDELAQPTTRRGPPGQMAIATLAAASEAALDRGDYRVYVAGAAQTTSAATLGRFLHDDTALGDKLRAVLRHEEAHDGDAVHAEIAHHLGIGPMKGATNISRRPVMRDYEIDISEASGAAPERRITLDDLFVSVSEGRVVLRSKRLGRRVIPHLSTAHGFDSPGLSIYRFLAHLQGDDVQASASWSWGAALARAPFLPRVVHKRFVFALATWRLAAGALSELCAARGAARVRALAKLRAEQRLPRQVCLVDGDNILPIDLENVLSVESLVQACKGESSIVLREQFPDEDELVARGAEGAYCHELFVPLWRDADPVASPAVRVSPVVRAGADDRRALPGSEWLFAKVYCGPGASDRFLVEVVEPLVRELRVAGQIDQWFFIRYADPDLHLRLRFRGEPRTIWTEVAPRFFAAASSMQKELHKLVVDTYDPEVERYGGEHGIEPSHGVFEADSDVALAVVRRFRSDSNARWRLALLSMNTLLDDLGLGLSAKRDIVGAARDKWGRQLDAGPELVRKIGESFRRMRGELEALVSRPPDAYRSAVEAMRARSAALAQPAAQLRALDGDGALAVPLPLLAESYLHMLVNRMLRGGANKHELVLYHLLYRLYDGALARSRTRATTKPAVMLAS